MPGRSLRAALLVAAAAAVLAAGSAASPILAANEDAAPAKEPIPFKRNAEPFEPASLARIALALGLVIALAAGGLYALRRYLPSSLGRAPGGASRINVIEIRRITPRLTLLLVEIDGQPIFLAQSGDRVRPLPLERTDGSGGAR